MKIFLKRANRGLLLSAVCLIILVVYVSIDYITFSTQKDDIRQTVSDYISEVADCNVNSSDLTQYKDQINTIINTYWSEKNYDQTTFNVSDLKIQLNDFIQDDKAFIDILKASSSVKSLKISKSGPKFAYAELDYSFDATGNNNSYLFAPGSIDTFANYNLYNSDDSDYSDKSYYDMSCNCHAYIYLCYENGMWRISSWDSYITDASYEQHKEN